MNLPYKIVILTLSALTSNAFVQCTKELERKPLAETHTDLAHILYSEGKKSPIKFSDYNFTQEQKNDVNEWSTLGKVVPNKRDKETIHSHIAKNLLKNFETSKDFLTCSKVFYNMMVTNVIQGYPINYGLNESDQLVHVKSESNEAISFITDKGSTGGYILKMYENNENKNYLNNKGNDTNLHNLSWTSCLRKLFAASTVIFSGFCIHSLISNSYDKLKKFGGFTLTSLIGFLITSKKNNRSEINPSDTSKLLIIDNIQRINVFRNKIDSAENFLKKNQKIEK